MTNGSRQYSRGTCYRNLLWTREQKRKSLYIEKPYRVQQGNGRTIGDQFISRQLIRTPSSFLDFFLGTFLGKSSIFRTINKVKTYLIATCCIPRRIQKGGPPLREWTKKRQYSVRKCAHTTLIGTLSCIHTERRLLWWDDVSLIRTGGSPTICRARGCRKPGRTAAAKQTHEGSMQDYYISKTLSSGAGELMSY